MNLSRLGNAIVLGNVARLIPESKKDVAALQDMLDTVGFDVHIYEDCDEKVMLPAIFSPNFLLKASLTLQ